MKVYSAWGAFLLSTIIIGASSGLAQDPFPNEQHHFPPPTTNGPPVVDTSVAGTNIVNLLDDSLAVGTNTLFTYGGGSVGGSSGFAGFQLGTVPSGVTAQLLDTGSAVQLAVTPKVTVATNAPTLTHSVSDGNLNLSWPSDHIGWRLLVQTNHLAGISLDRNDWSTVAGSAGTNQVSIPIDTTKPTEFYRMVYP